MKKGDLLALRYRLLIRADLTEAATMEALFKAFSKE
jgi:hypothetical protein